MPVTLETLRGEGYFLATYTDRINEEELVANYERFLSSHDSMGHFIELCDMSSCDMSEITLGGLTKLSGLIRDFCKRNEIESAKCACYSPHEINHSLMALYDAASKDSVEITRVFRRKQDAIDWLLE